MIQPSGLSIWPYSVCRLIQSLLAALYTMLIMNPFQALDNSCFRANNAAPNFCMAGHYGKRHKTNNSHIAWHRFTRTGAYYIKQNLEHVKKIMRLPSPSLPLELFYRFFFKTENPSWSSSTRPLPWSKTKPSFLCGSHHLVSAVTANSSRPWDISCNALVRYS